MHDARIASALRKIFSSTSFRKRVSVEEQRAQKYNRFLRGRQIAQKYLHPQIFLMTQFRNVLSKWHHESTVFTLTSPKTQIARSASEPRLRGILAEGELEIEYLEQRSSVILIAADHKVLNEGSAGQGSTNLARKSCQEYSSDMHWMRVEEGLWKGDILVADVLRSWRNWTRQKSTLEDSRQRRK